MRKEPQVELSVGCEDERVARRGTGLAAELHGENRRLEDRRSAGVAVSLMQVVKNFANEFVLGNKANHAQRPTTITFQRVDLKDPFDELGPTFSKGGTLFWRELGLGR